MPGVKWTQADLDAHRAKLQPGIITPVKVNKADAKLEKQLESMVENYLRVNEYEFLHLSFRSREKKGWPDISTVINGVPLFIELKSATGKLSEDQIRVLAKLKDQGAWVVVATTFEEVHRVIEKARRMPHESSAGLDVSMLEKSG